MKANYYYYYFIYFLFNLIFVLSEILRKQKDRKINNQIQKTVTLKTALPEQ